jgi:hypothetical protein
MRIAYKNIIDSLDESALVASSEADGYPISNVQEQRLSKKWKSSTVSTNSVVIDLDPITTVLSSINTLGILGHNITTAATITFSANTTDSWGAPAFTTTMTVIEDGVILKFLDSSQLYRFWKLEVSNQTSIEIGRIWLGEYITIDPSSALSFNVIKKRSDNVTHSRNRQKFASIGLSWRRFELSFPKTEEVTILKLNTMIDYVGNHSAFIFCNFDTLRDYILVEPCYVSIDGEISFNHIKNMTWKWDIALEEEK